VVGAVIALIFLSYARGPEMDARPVGPGAADTGGANALGEFLAGENLSEAERSRRDLREGRLIDPVDWPHGVRLVVAARDTGVGERTVWLWGGAGGPAPSTGITTGFVDPAPAGEELTIDPDRSHASMVIPRAEFARIFREGRPGAGIYISPTRAVTVSENRLLDAEGRPLEPIELPLTPRDETVEGEPIEILVVLE
jgi:hypothetical protein